jgi:sigma-B regulation protein RsbU (phosphoserine phosphatase)
MMAWVLGVTGLILAAVILWSYLAARHRLEAEMEAKAVSLADGAARRIDAQLGVLQGVGGGMALALEAQAPDLRFARIRDMQTRCLREHPGIYGVCVALDPDLAPPGWTDLAPWEHREGDRLKYVDLSGPERAHTREDWYTLPRELDRPVWSEPYEWSGVLMVTYSVPIHMMAAGKRRVAGVITCDLTLDWLEQMIAELPLGKGGYGLLMSRNGTYVCHPLPELVLNETVFSIAEERGDPGLRATGQRMVSGEPGILPFVSFVNGKLSWLAFTPLQSADWIMGALISREEMHAAVLRLSHRQAAVGLAGLLLLCLAVALIARSITRPIWRLRDAASHLAGGNLDVHLPSPRGDDEVAQLTRAFGDMRDRLRQYLVDLRETMAARERMHSELRIAHEIQMGLVPKTFPPFPDRRDLDLYAVLEPAREVGGDFYDFFPLDDDRLVVAIGDVSGKGVPAALLMAVTRSFLRSQFRATADPAEVLGNVNGELVEGNESCMFVTLFCAVLNLADGSLRYANAGHNPPLLRHPDGHLEWLALPRGPVVGAMPGATYATGTLVLPADAILILYTDGVTEAMNPASELYGEERMIAQVDAAPGHETTCRILIDGLLADIRAFAAGAEPSDDITMLVLRRKAVAPDQAGDDAPLPSPTLNLMITNDLDHLDAALRELDAFLEAQDAAPTLRYAVRLALEELAVNTVKYGYDDQDCHVIEATVTLDAPATLTIRDDGHPFDPLNDAPLPPLDAPIEERPIGGLGLHLLRTMGLAMDYRREAGYNVLHITFPQAE